MGESAGSVLRLNNNDVTVEACLPYSPYLAAPPETAQQKSVSEVGFWWRGPDFEQYSLYVIPFLLLVIILMYNKKDDDTGSIVQRYHIYCIELA